MNETRKALVYAVAAAALVVLLAVAYVWAQSRVSAHRAALPIQQYFDCLAKMATFDWSKFPGEKPSGSEVCKDLATRQRV